MPSILTKMWSGCLNQLNQNRKLDMDRRGFIQKFGRGSMLMALAAMAGILVARKQVHPDQECSDDFLCRECRRLSNCQLPEAITTRDHGEKG